MDPLSKLPPECLQHILQILVNDNTSISSLIALLSTNKYIASMTLPYIYGDINKLDEGCAVSPVKNDQRACLVRMLLQQLFDEGLPEVVLLSYGFKTVSTTYDGEDNATSNDTYNRDDDEFSSARAKSPFDYLAFVRHFNLDLEHIIPKHRSLYGHSPQVTEALEPHFSAYDEIFMSRRAIRQVFEGAIIYWQVCWSLASPILEQLESLTIPLADIQRYMGVLDRLERLEHVRFNLDGLFAQRYKAKDGHYAIFNHAIRSAQAMVPFIKEHNRLFEGRLQFVSVCDTGKWWEVSAMCSEEILWEVYRASPPLHEPKHLCPTNWMQFAAHALSTDLDYVVTLTTRRPTVDWFDRPVDVQNILSRCRSLKELSVLSVGKDGFKWAVQEKKAMQDRLYRYGEGEHTLLHNPTTLSPLEMDQSKHILVPLSNVRIAEFGTAEEIDDIAFAFSQTLEIFTVNKYSGQDLFIPAHYIGQGWVKLPFLTTLSFRGCWNRLVIDRDLLLHCPSLVDLELVDFTFDYNCSDIVSCSVASLTRLEKLQLVGWPALTFHPGTFSSTKRIKYLRMSTASDDEDTRFIPPLEELELSFGSDAIGVSATTGQESTPAATASPVASGIHFVNMRPRWSWDWLLPHLKTLELTSEFAQRFQFRMLQGCPSLRSLHLDNTTYEDDLRRVLTTDDLFVAPGFSDLGNQDNTSSGADEGVKPSSLERIVAWKVSQLILTGDWSIDDSVLGPFLWGMFPCLQEFTESGVGGYTLSGMMDVIRIGGRGWKEVTSSRLHRDGDEEMKELGLYSVDDDLPKGVEVLDVEVFFHGCSTAFRVTEEKVCD
ncbi:hypothetical protein BGZ95_002221 [Linnemannia exigua]|uniref:F-box domain-containing protein n=1 Tax=Linnemannia exigua TaxID=604196 RepID=A0AAD4D682_9FUNG|nr:hypothetical protein BGZ95_002221 [Linnemannia exigua]